MDAKDLVFQWLKEEFSVPLGVKIEPRMPGLPIVIHHPSTGRQCSIWVWEGNCSLHQYTMAAPGLGVPAGARGPTLSVHLSDPRAFERMESFLLRGLR